MSKRKKLIFAAIAVALVGTVTSLPLGCTPPPTSAPTRTQAANEVIITGRSFIPRTITVTAGTAVTWTNIDDAEDHIVASADGLFYVYLVAPDFFSYTFNEPGTFSYRCDIHEDMIGYEVIVE